MIKNRRNTNFRNLLFVVIVGVISYGCGYIFDEQDTIQNAEAYQAEGKHSAAIIALKKVLKNNSSNKEARLLLAKSYVGTGQGALAEKELSYAKKFGMPMSELVSLWGESLLLQKEYKRIFEEAPLTLANTPARKAKLALIHGYAYLSLNNKGKAKSLFLQVKNSQHLAVDADIALSRLAMANNLVGQAYEYIKNAINADRKNVMAWLLKGRIMLVKQNIDGAQEAFEQVVKLNGSISEEFQARVYLVQIALSQKNMELAKERVGLLTKAVPRHPTSKYFSALIDFQQKNYGQARTSLDEALVMAPNDLRSKLLLGAVHFAQGNYEQSNKHLTYFIENVPSHIYARKMLAAVQIKLGRSDEAFQSLKSVINKDNQDAELLAMVGQTAMYNNRPAEAVDYLKQARGSKPENIALKTELAKAYMQNGSFDEAIAELKSIKGKGASQAKIMLVYAHLQKQDIKTARQLAQQLLKDSPSLPVSYTLAGTVELASGKRDQAMIYFSKSLDMKPDHMPALLALARMSFENGDINKASGYYEKVLLKDSRNEKAIVGLAVIDDQTGSLDKAISRLEQAIDNSPGTLMPSIILGRYYIKRKDPAKALGIITTLAKHHQDKSNIQSLLVQAQLLAEKKQNALQTAESIIKKWPKLPAGYMDLARVQVALKKVDLAEASLGKALKVQPDLLPAKTSLFMLYMQSGKIEKATFIASQLKKDHPKLPVGSVLKGDVHMVKKKYLLAQKEYSSAMQIQRVNGIVNKLSAAYELGGQANKAVSVLQRWIEESPDDVKSRMQLAVLYTRLNDHKKAKLHYRILLEKNPENVAVLNNLALLSMGKEPQQAIRYAEKAYSLQPGIAAIGDTYGWILYRVGKLDKALPLLSEAANKSKHPSIQYHHAVVLAKTGDKKQAKGILQNLADMKFDEASDASELLKSLLNK